MELRIILVGVLFQCFLSLVVESQAPPRKCCLPEQHEISSEIVGSLRRRDREESVLESTRSYVDLTKSMKATEGSADYLNGTRVEYRAVANYREKALWIIIDKRGCTKYAFNETLERCVPENAKFFQSGSVGGSHDVIADFWQMERRSEGKRGLEMLSFTRDHCVPVSNSFEGERVNLYDHVPEKASYTGVHFNFRDGIEDPDRVFTLPSSCRK